MSAGEAPASWSLTGVMLADRCACCGVEPGGKPTPAPQSLLQTARTVRAIARRAGNTVLNSTFNNVIECSRGTSGSGEGSAECTDRRLCPAPGSPGTGGGQRQGEDAQGLPSSVTDAEKAAGAWGASSKRVLSRLVHGVSGQTGHCRCGSVPAFHQLDGAVCKRWS